ncbi:histone deacetylase [Saccharothrix coeruleofusca]|uniref:Class II histone deacetylase n=1 Tax=Saccharothrix coeruleofusca TaxID=33919 RepID=A0A918AP72_9PSEU|nr:histone deacetylase [Saccharothrix coeruleofusca]MBP2339297.1 acetoin utilization deacetylase AcuC-like enzyme [Saccharothrix coeruleofusca]GGP58758.1 class II histone deacetylase [Saccharothrix coeruleofusca]
MELFWHDACLAHDTGTGLWELPGRWEWLDLPEPHPENAARLRTFRHALRHGPVAPHLTWCAGRLATDEELRRVHTPAYLAALEAACAGPDPVALEVNTVVGPGSWDAVRAAAGTALAAWEAVADGRTRLAYALVRPPGHHAQPAAADGYCLVNNAALVAETARRAGRRVAVLDWDVHHGNGTQEVFRADPDVLTASIHMRHGPWGENHRQTGAPEEEAEANINVELSLGAGDRAYARALDEVVVPALREFGADFLVCASGFDGSAFDPNGRHNLTAGGYRAIGRRVAALDLPTVLTQEGGYLRGYAALCLHALVEGLLGLELLEDPLAYVPDDTQLVDRDLARVRAALAGRWRFARAPRS